MTPQQLLEYTRSKPGAWPDNPWGHEHPVVKEGRPGKIFLFIGATTAGVKAGATRETADEWLERYPDDATVMPYIGRSGWNDRAFGAAIPDDEILEAVDESYRLVVSKLAAKQRPAGWDD